MNQEAVRVFSPQDNRRFLLVLALVTTLLALGLAITAASVWQQSRDVETTARLQADSAVSMSFQLEREFLRTRHELSLALSRPDTAHWQGVQARYDILVSRIDLLRDNPSMERLAQSEAYQLLLPQLQDLLHAADPLMERPSVHLSELQAVVQRLVMLGPAVQALSQAANGLASRQMEEQLSRVLKQERQLLWLLIGQVLVLLLASAGLWWRQRTQWREHRHMQQLNAELAAARDQAEQASLAKTQFLANMSHELRTPFNGMLGMFHLLEQDQLTPVQREHLATAHQSARHLLNLLNDILDLSALDAGKLRICPEPVQLRAIVAEVQQWIQAHAEQKKLLLQVFMDRGCPQWVLTDPTRVRQILLNLMNNAIKFTDTGGVSVDVRCAPTDDEQVDWHIEIRDTGCGMDEATLARLFQRFVRADESLTRTRGGTGLGLEISRTLAQRMNGDITATSIPGEGSCFTLKLRTPLSASPPETARQDVPQASDRENAAWHVLVAEDHPVNRKVLGIILRDLGHRVSFAEDGLQALNMAREQDFDLVLMDIHMPHMDGLESARAIRALPGRRARIPIIAVTADVMNEAQERSLQAGMDDFIAKPIEPRRLQALMSASKRRHEETARAQAA